MTKWTELPIMIRASKQSIVRQKYYIFAQKMAGPEGVLKLLEEVNSSLLRQCLSLSSYERFHGSD